jgi:Ca-activated chloride channel family protein
VVKEYRLIGFDNKKSALADKSTILQGGEVGSGHSLMAVFELSVSPGILNVSIAKPTSLASLQLSYKNPGNNETVEEKYEVKNEFQSADSCLKFATSVIMFGSLLKQSQFSNNYSFDDVSNLASSSAKPNDLLQKEFVELVSKAKKMYPGGKKKKG